MVDTPQQQGVTQQEQQAESEVGHAVATVARAEQSPEPVVAGLAPRDGAGGDAATILGEAGRRAPHAATIAGSGHGGVVERHLGVERTTFQPAPAVASTTQASPRSTKPGSLPRRNASTAHRHRRHRPGLPTGVPFHVTEPVVRRGSGKFAAGRTRRRCRAMASSRVARSSQPSAISQSPSTNWMNFALEPLQQLLQPMLAARAAVNGRTNRGPRLPHQTSGRVRHCRLLSRNRRRRQPSPAGNGRKTSPQALPSLRDRDDTELRHAIAREFGRLIALVCPALGCLLRERRTVGLASGIFSERRVKAFTVLRGRRDTGKRRRSFVLRFLAAQDLQPHLLLTVPRLTLRKAASETPNNVPGSLLALYAKGRNVSCEKRARPPHARLLPSHTNLSTECRQNGQRCMKGSNVSLSSPRFRIPIRGDFGPRTVEEPSRSSTDDHLSNDDTLLDQERRNGESSEIRSARRGPAGYSLGEC
jgi:hypothetical protein